MGLVRYLKLRKVAKRQSTRAKRLRNLRLRQAVLEGEITGLRAKAAEMRTDAHRLLVSPMEKIGELEEEACRKEGRVKFIQEDIERHVKGVYDNVDL